MPFPLPSPQLPYHRESYAAWLSSASASIRELEEIFARPSPCIDCINTYVTFIHNALKELAAYYPSNEEAQEQVDLDKLTELGWMLVAIGNRWDSEVDFVGSFFLLAERKGVNLERMRRARTERIEARWTREAEQWEKTSRRDEGVTKNLAFNLLWILNSKYAISAALVLGEQDMFVAAMSNPGPGKSSDEHGQG
ncbi:MAG: hypothetical protein Q9222_005682 [Ikaeria aurantiellina]